MSKVELDYRDSFIESTKVELYEGEYAAGRYNFYEWDLEKSVMNMLLGRYLNGKAAKYLDFACGTGRVARFMMPFVEQAVGVDISPSMIEIARAKCPGVEFIVEDVTVNPERLKQFGPFDLITVFRFLAPAEESLRIASLEILADCLCANGIMIINNNANRTSLLYPALIVRSLFGRPFKESTNYIKTLPYGDLCKLLCDVGLDVVETAGICFLPSIVARRLPRFLWYPIERALNRANLFASVAVNQILVAKRRLYKDVK